MKPLHRSTPNPANQPAFAWLAIMAIAVLTGCATSEPTVTGGPGSEEAGIRYESARREYNNCIRNEGPGTATCDALKALYERDRDAYESSVK